MNSRKGEHTRSNSMYELLFLLLLYASHTWHKVRQRVFDRCIGRGNVVVVRSPTVHQPHVYIVTTLLQRQELETPLSVYCFTAAVVLYTDFVASKLNDRF